MTKILSRKQILDTGFFKVFEDDVEIKTGAKRKYFSAVRVPAVSVFPLGENGEIYLLDQYRYIYDSRIIEAVAGTIEEGENPLETAKRELLEEAGIKAREWNKIGNSVAAGSFITWTQHLFVARGLDFLEQKLEESEEIKVVKMQFEEALKLVLDGKINTSSTSFGILLINKLINSGKI